jgi:hypothetical protein
MEDLRWIYEVNPLIERGGVGELRILHYVDRDGDDVYEVSIRSMLVVTIIKFKGSDKYKIVINNNPEMLNCKIIR